MTKFAMVSLYSIGFVFCLTAMITFFLALSGRVEFANAFGAFVVGASFTGVAAIIELLRKIAGKS